MSTEESQRMPHTLSMVSGELHFGEVEKPLEQGRKAYRVGNAFTLGSKEFKRGFTIRLFPNDPRVEALMNTGYLVRPVI
ncbi:MAG: hypothetical protein IPL39_25720 [Opitutaceae bacterium]|nr:hypothetical protein [Opitutaceae bacterium]